MHSYTVLVMVRHDMCNGSGGQHSVYFDHRSSMGLIPIVPSSSDGHFRIQEFSCGSMRTASPTWASLPSSSHATYGPRSIAHATMISARMSMYCQKRTFNVTNTIPSAIDSIVLHEFIVRTLMLTRVDTRASSKDPRWLVKKRHDVLQRIPYGHMHETMC